MKQRVMARAGLAMVLSFVAARVQAQVPASEIGVCLPSNDGGADGWAEVQRRLGELGGGFAPVRCDAIGLLVQMGSKQLLVQLTDVPPAARAWVVAHALREQHEIAAQEVAPALTSPSGAAAPEVVAPPTFLVPEGEGEPSDLMAEPSGAAPEMMPEVTATPDVSAVEPQLQLRRISDRGRSRHALTLRLGYMRWEDGGEFDHGGDIALRYRWRRLILGARARLGIPSESWRDDGLEADFGAELGVHIFDLYMDPRHRFRLQGQAFASWGFGGGESCDEWDEDCVVDDAAHGTGGVSASLGLRVALSERWEIGIDHEVGVRVSRGEDEQFDPSLYFSNALVLGLRFGDTY